VALARYALRRPHEPDFNYFAGDRFGLFLDIGANIGTSAMRNMEWAALAASDEPGTLTLHIPQRGGARTGDASLDLDTLAWVKVDVEGHADAVLRGAEDTIRRCRPAGDGGVGRKDEPGGARVLRPSRLLSARVEWA
jgi:hypothetical protein